MKKPKKHYVNNKDLYNALVEWAQYDFDPKVRLFKYTIPNPVLKYESYTRDRFFDWSKVPAEIKVNVADYVAYGIHLIAINVFKKSNWNRYTFREEMISAGVMDCLRYGVRNFNPKYTNPFAYFTQIINEAFKRVVKEEKKLLYGKYKSLQETFITDDNNELCQIRVEMHDNINEFIGKYEKSIADKKLKAKKKPTGLELFYEANNESNTTDSSNPGELDRTDRESEDSTPCSPELPDAARVCENSN